MKILFLGDSITEGYCASSYDKSYVPQVGKILNADVYNYGIGGTRIARQFISHTDIRIVNFDMNLRTEIMERDADIVVLFGGTNDFGHGTAPIGNTNDNNVFTFNGAVNTLLDKLIKMYEKNKILVILPLPRNNQNSEDGDSPQVKNGIKAKLSVYKEIIRFEANNRSIYTVDYATYFENVSGLQNDLFADGLHPNDKGYKLLAKLISNDIKKLIKKI